MSWYNLYHCSFILVEYVKDMNVTDVYNDVCSFPDKDC